MTFKMLECGFRTAPRRRTRDSVIHVLRAILGRLNAPAQVPRLPALQPHDSADKATSATLDGELLASPQPVAIVVTDASNDLPADEPLNRHTRISDDLPAAWWDSGRGAHVAPPSKPASIKTSVVASVGSALESLSQARDARRLHAGAGAGGVPPWSE